jgi:hypothetical protein
MKIAYGILDELAFVLFVDDENKYLLTHPCVNVFFECWAYGLPDKKYQHVVFSTNLEFKTSSKPFFRKTWDSLVNGSQFKKTQLSLVGKNIQTLANTYK